MDEAKRRRLRKAGYRVGDAEEFLFDCLGSHRRTTESVPNICANCIHLNLDDGVMCGYYWPRSGQLYATGLQMVCPNHRRDPDE